VQSLLLGRLGRNVLLAVRSRARQPEIAAVFWVRPPVEQSYRGLLFHDLRRTAARNLLRAGNSDAEVKKIGGWKTTAVFHRYAIIDRRMMADAIRKLERYREEQAAIRSRMGILWAYLTIPRPKMLPPRNHNDTANC
jgi:hypothetical protein